MINELRQSETRSDAKITFLADHTFLYKIGTIPYIVINELWQSETRPDAEIIFLADHTFLYKIGTIPYIVINELRQSETQQDQLEQFSMKREHNQHT
jgi:hypothetical protein